MAEKVGPHETVIALGMFLWKTHIFVHIEGNHIFETYLTSLIKLNKVLVESERTASGGTTQNKGFLGCWISCIDAAGDILCCPVGKGAVVGLDDYAHGVE